MALESLLTQSSARFPAASIGAYDEAAFRHLLALERRRAENAARPLLLVLVSFTRAPESGVRMASGTAAGVFAGLRHAVREVDLVGWYRQDRVAAAALIQGQLRAESEAPARSRAAERIGKAVEASIPLSLVPDLRVRVLELPRRSGE